MDAAEVDQRFDECFEDSAALGRGESDEVGRATGFYGIPLILSTDAACLILTDEAQVRAAAQQQVDALRSVAATAARCSPHQTTLINAFSAAHHALVARVRADGSQIARARGDLLITDTSGGGPAQVNDRSTRLPVSAESVRRELTPPLPSVACPAHIPSEHPHHGRVTASHEVD